MDTFQTRTKLILNFVGNKYHYATPLKTFTPFTSKYISFMATSTLKTPKKEKKIKVKGIIIIISKIQKTPLVYKNYTR
jgi:hypothetical protein